VPPPVKSVLFSIVVLRLSGVRALGAFFSFSMPLKPRKEAQKVDDGYDHDDHKEFDQ